MNLTAAELDRMLAPLIRRVDMMVARGVLNATNDASGVQTMQLGLLEGEVADNVERFQTYGLSTVPPPGGDALIVFVEGNRDHGIALAVNDRASRPTGTEGGGVVLYNNADCSVSLTPDGNIAVKSAQEVTIGNENGSITLAADGTITIKGQSIVIDTPARTFTLEDHRHQEVQQGTDISGEPVP